jgi:hypothetical protein
MAKSLKSAIEALEAARDVHTAAFTKLDEVIAHKRILGCNCDDEIRLKARASRRITHCNRMIAELRVADVAVEAPTREEIEKTRELIARIVELAVRDAALRSGFKIIEAAMGQADALSNNIG